MNAVSDDLVSFGAVSLGAIVSVTATFAFLAAVPHAPPAPLLDTPQYIVPEFNLPELPEIVGPLIPPASTPQGPVTDFAIIWDLREESKPTANFAVIRDVSVASPGAVDFALLWYHDYGGRASGGDEGRWCMAPSREQISRPRSEHHATR